MVSSMQAIHEALSSYTTLSNNSRITLNLDGQKFSVIIRLLTPDTKVRVNDKMNILVSNQIYVIMFSLPNRQRKPVIDPLSDSSRLDEA